jgi:hypothetical protein
MRVRFVIGTAAVLVLLSPAPSLAQEQPGTLGLTLGYPGAIGIVWHVADRVAVRPELSFSRGWTDRDDSLFGSDRSNWTIGVGVSALFYLTKADRLRTFVSPRYAYGRSSSTSSSTGNLPVVSDITSSASSWSGSFGAEYVFSRRFSAFGEIGVAYSNASSEISLAVLRSRSHSIGTRTSGGFVLYF